MSENLQLKLGRNILIDNFITNGLNDRFPLETRLVAGSQGFGAAPASTAGAPAPSCCHQPGTLLVKDPYYKTSNLDPISRSINQN